MEKRIKKYSNFFLLCESNKCVKKELLTFDNFLNYEFGVSKTRVSCPFAIFKKSTNEP